MFDNLPASIQTSLPFLTFIGFVFILAGVGISPDKFRKGLIIEAIGVLFVIGGGYGSHSLGLPFPRVWWLILVFALGGFGLAALAFKSHVRNQSDWAILFSFVSLLSLFCFGWSLP